MLALGRGSTELDCKSHPFPLRREVSTSVHSPSENSKNEVYDLLEVGLTSTAMNKLFVTILE